MRTLRRSSDGAVTLAAAGIVAAAAVLTGGAIVEPGTFVAFVLLIAVSELFEVMLPNDAAHSMGLAPALGFVMLGTHPGAEIVLAFGLGAALAVAVRAAARRPLRVVEAAAHALALTLATGVYAVARDADPFEPFAAGDTSISPFGLVLVLLAIVVVQSTLHAVREARGQRIRFWPVFRGQVGSTAALQLSIVSVGALLSLSYPSMGIYAFVLFLAPLAATQFAFRQFASIRTTYLQTIRALSKVPEMAGYTQPGHSRRVAELSVSIARELGVADGEVPEIEYAALLHDIGRVGIPDPEEDGYRVSQAELALVGANIVRETGHFPRVADMIERQQEPYRRRGEDIDRTLPSGAKIIKVASAYDDLIRPGGPGLNTWDALERLHDGMAHEYDPQVIHALTRVLEKRGTI